MLSVVLTILTRAYILSGCAHRLSLANWSRLKLIGIWIRAATQNYRLAIQSYQSDHHNMCQFQASSSFFFSFLFRFFFFAFQIIYESKSSGVRFYSTGFVSKAVLFGWNTKGLSFCCSSLWIHSRKSFYNKIKLDYGNGLQNGWIALIKSILKNCHQKQKQRKKLGACDSNEYIFP